MLGINVSTLEDASLQHDKAQPPQKRKFAQASLDVVQATFAIKR